MTIGKIIPTSVKLRGKTFGGGPKLMNRESANIVRLFHCDRFPVKEIDLYILRSKINVTSKLRLFASNGYI